jgi:hypothetical protein
MARHLFAILDDLTANLAELKATLAPLALIGGTVVSEARKPPFSPAASNRQPPFLQPFRMRSQASRTASR